MRYQRYITLITLFLLIGPLVLAQGVPTVASKDDWEEINFEFNQAVLVDGFPSLLRMAELLNKNPGYKVKVEGNADQIGSDRYNMRLGERRANTVKAFLVKYGANENQIQIASQGERNPKVASREKNARFMNRRVTLTVTDETGKIIAAGGMNEVLKAMQAFTEAQRKCCEDILKRLDRLDEVADMMRKTLAENDALRKELGDLRKQHSDLDAYVRGLPKPLTQQETAQIVDTRTAEQIEKARMPRYATINMNAGLDSNRDLTFTGKGRLFLPFKEQLAVQLQGEYMHFHDRQEGQIDFGLVDRFVSKAQAGIFGSFKHVNFAEGARQSVYGKLNLLPINNSNFGSALEAGFPVGGGWLGQASGTLDYIFSRGRVGVFGAKGFMNEAVLGRTQLVQNSIMREFYIRTIDQVGVSTTLGLKGDAYLEANLGYLKSRGYADRPGGTARFVFPISDRFAFTLEGGMNETLLTRENWGRVVAGFQFGNFMRPRDYLEGYNGVQHAVPADIPRVRFELLTRDIRTGNSAPVADAGPDQIGVAAGTITLNGSGSFDPEGDPIFFQWSQIAGPAVAISGQNTSVATFTAAQGQTYAFRLTVTDNRGAQGIARVTVSTATPTPAQIVRFTASPGQITSGQSSTLDWQVVGAQNVTISGLGSVPANGSRQVSPTQTTTYTLTATNASGEVTATTTIVVTAQPMPTLTACQVQPTNILAGETATIFVSSQNATSVNISNGVGNVALSGSSQVSPAQTTTYTVTATGANNQTATCTVTVRVTTGEAPRVVSFTGAPLTINSGDTSTLSWNVENATSVTIDHGIGTVPASGTRQVSPTSTTTYTLTASNANGSTPATVTITVNGGGGPGPTPQQPTIASCAASPGTSPGPGQPVSLSWTATNATAISITGVTGAIPVAGPFTVNPQTAATYTITATGAAGTTPATCQVQVNVTLPEPPQAIIAGPQTIETIYQQITLDASGSVNPAGGTLTYIWEPLETGAAVLDQGQPQTRVQFANDIGVYRIRLTVRDPLGRTASTIVTVNLKRVVVG